MAVWEKIEELMKIIDDIDSDSHREFITELHENLDPHNVEEEISQKQIDFLESLYEQYCNDDEDAFADWE